MMGGVCVYVTKINLGRLGHKVLLQEIVYQPKILAFPKEYLNIFFDILSFLHPLCESTLNMGNSQRVFEYISSTVIGILSIEDICII